MVEIEDTKDSNFQYINCHISNPISATAPLQCSLVANFSTPFLGNTSRYKGSIVRFSIPISSIPYFQCAPSSALTSAITTTRTNIGIGPITTINCNALTVGLGTGTVFYIQTGTQQVFGPMTMTAASGAGATSLSINSFTVPGSSGIIIPTGSSIVQYPTPYKVTLSNNGVDFPAYVNLIQLDNTYNVYFVQQFLDSVNVAVNIAYSALVATVGLSSQFWPNRAPFFIFDPSTNLLSLTTDAGSWENTATGLPRIWLNTPLAALFSNMQKNYQATNSNSGKDSYLIVATRGATTIVEQPPVAALASTMDYLSAVTSAVPSNSAITSVSAFSIQQSIPTGAQLLMTLADSTCSIPKLGTPGYILKLTQNTGTGTVTIQFQSITTTFGIAINAGNLFLIPPTQLITTEEVPSVVGWWNTMSMVVTTTLLPARSEIVPSVDPTQYSTQNIVSDFFITPEDRLSGNASLLYLPQAEYRWFDLTKEDTLRQLDLFFYATDATGLRENWKPITLAPGQAASAKLLFAHKCVTDKKMSAALGGSGFKKRRLL